MLRLSANIFFTKYKDCNVHVDVPADIIVIVGSKDELENVEKSTIIPISKECVKYLRLLYRRRTSLKLFETTIEICRLALPQEIATKSFNERHKDFKYG